MASFNIYVISYKRSNEILTNNLLEYCTYIVRKSEEQLYKDAGVKTLAVEDNEINSVCKVMNWAIENTPEDVIAIIDDDIKSFSYRLETNTLIQDKETITREIERIAQLIYDLGIGYASPPIDSSPMYYDSEFKFTGVTGPVKIINKAKCKARFNEIPFLLDMDFLLQELLVNRVVLIPRYIIQDVGLNTNKGGTNDNKSVKLYMNAGDTLKNKWGKYYKPGKDAEPGKIMVKR